MKAYSTPEILFQNIMPNDDMLAASSNIFSDVEGFDGDNQMAWWG